MKKYCPKCIYEYTNLYAKDEDKKFLCEFGTEIANPYVGIRCTGLKPMTDRSANVDGKCPNYKTTLLKYFTGCTHF